MKSPPGLASHINRCCGMFGWTTGAWSRSHTGQSARARRADRGAVVRVSPVVWRCPSPSAWRPDRQGARREPTATPAEVATSTSFEIATRRADRAASHTPGQPLGTEKTEPTAQPDRPANDSNQRASSHHTGIGKAGWSETRTAANDDGERAGERDGGLEVAVEQPGGPTDVRTGAGNRLGCPGGAPGAGWRTAASRAASLMNADGGGTT